MCAQEIQRIFFELTPPKIPFKQWQIRFIHFNLNMVTSFQERNYDNIISKIHRTWFEIADGFWCDEPTYKILVRKGLIGANGKLMDTS